MGLQPLACWECVIESRQGHGYLFLVSAVCCQLEVCLGLITLPGKSSECGVSVIVKPW